MQNSALERLENCLFLLETETKAKYDTVLATIYYKKDTDEYTVVGTNGDQPVTIRGGKRDVFDKLALKNVVKSKIGKLIHNYSGEVSQVKKAK
jgi:hypothetical protein